MANAQLVPEGITNPPIDDLLEAAEGSKYGLVIYAAKRARQINAYYSQLGEGLLENVGPLVETHVQEKPLSVALREIDAGLLTATPVTPEQAAADLYATTAGSNLFSTDSLDDDPLAEAAGDGFGIAPGDRDVT